MHMLEHIRVDDWVFGVSSVSKDGFESPVASAVPGGAFKPYVAPPQTVVVIASGAKQSRERWSAGLLRRFTPRNDEGLGKRDMAGGWTRDGAVQDQIDDTVKDAILRARALTPQGESAEECDDCGEPIRRSGGTRFRASEPASPASRNATRRSSTRPSIGGAARIASCAEIAVLHPGGSISAAHGGFTQIFPDARGMLVTVNIVNIRAAFA